MDYKYDTGKPNIFLTKTDGSSSFLRASCGLHRWQKWAIDGS